MLGPVLFLAYINDLPEYLTNGSSANLFADDSILYRRISSTDDARKLQQDLENLQTWEKDWQMEFHPKKCQVLNITNKKKPVKFTYTIHGHVLDTVKSASVTHLLQQLNWPTLQERRAQAKVVMFYKIVNNLVAIPAPTVRQPIVIRGYSHRYLVPFARTIVYQHSFYPDANKLWNSIPPSLMLCENAASFSQQVQ